MRDLGVIANCFEIAPSRSMTVMVAEKVQDVSSPDLTLCDCYNAAAMPFLQIC
jgi:hypothetical protein